MNHLSKNPITKYCKSEYDLEKIGILFIDFPILEEICKNVVCLFPTKTPEEQALMAHWVKSILKTHVNCLSKQDQTRFVEVLQSTMRESIKYFKHAIQYKRSGQWKNDEQCLFEYISKTPLAIQEKIFPFWQKNDGKITDHFLSALFYFSLLPEYSHQNIKGLMNEKTILGDIANIMS